MPSAPTQRSAVPLDQQSVLPTVRGLPWWGAVVVATVITGIGAAIDASNTDSLGSVFKFCYLLGCVVAALAVRRRALFTAAAQPPLIAFLVGVITLYGLNSDAASSGLKSLIFKVLLPIANDFPWLALTFLVTLALVLARWFLTRDSATPTPARPRGADSGGPARQSADATRAATAAGKKPAQPRGTRPQGTAQATKKAARTGHAPPVAADRPRKRKPSAQRSTERPARPQGTSATAKQAAPTTQSAPTKQSAPKKRAAPSRQSGAVESAVAVDAPPARPAKKRATAGAVLRAEAGEQIEAIDVADGPAPAVQRRPNPGRPETSA